MISKFAWTLTFIVASLAATSAVSEPSSYVVEMAIYRVSGVPVTIYDEEYLARSTDDALEELLEVDTGFVSTKAVHIEDILESLRNGRGLSYSIAPGLVAPPPAKTTPGDSTRYFSDGMLPSATVDHVTLREGLKQLLLPLGLDYIVEAGGVRIDKADSLRNLPKARTYKPALPSTFLDRGGIRVGKDYVRLGGNESPRSVDLLRDRGVSAWARPSIVLLDSDEGVVTIGNPSAVEYLEAKPKSKNQEFVLRKTEENTGATTRVRVSTVKGDTVKLDIKLEIAYIDERETLAGTTLRAGRPVFRRRHLADTETVGLDHRIGFLTRVADGSDDVLLILAIVHRGVPAPAV